MSIAFLELEKGGFLNSRFIITIEPAVNGFVARYQVGNSAEIARVESESVETFLKEAVVSDEREYLGP